ncbi:MAG TPA: BON domain-containing protein [Kofleriaceae bacterium]
MRHAAFTGIMANNNGRTSHRDDHRGSSYNPSLSDRDEQTEHGYQDPRDNGNDRDARGRGDDRNAGRDFGDVRRGGGYGYDDMQSPQQGREMMNYRRDDHQFAGQSGSNSGFSNNQQSWGNEGGNRGQWGEFDRGGRWSPSSNYGSYDTQSPRQGRADQFSRQGGYGEGQYDMQNQYRGNREQWSDHGGSHGNNYGARGQEMNRGGYGLQGGQSGYGNGQYTSNVGQSGNFRQGGHEQSTVGREGGAQGAMGGESAGYGYRSDLNYKNDPSFRGPHSGKGPQGYQKSDERINEIVHDALTEHGHVDASNIKVEVKNGEVTLSGTVEDRNAKRLAEDIVASCSGVKDVTNHLRIQTGATESSSTGTQHLSPTASKKPSQPS